MHSTVGLIFNGQHALKILFDVGKKKGSWKEHIEISNIGKFGCKML
jgi:hypothetical protein